jgi:hypothetical protein
MPGIRPQTAMIVAESSRPRGMKYFGLLRSEIEPMRNFDKP